MSMSTVMGILYDGTDGLFGIAIVMLVWLVVYMRRRHVTPTREAVTGASWAAMVISFFVRYLELMNDWSFGVVIVILLGSIVMLINRE
jgi:hypothetical protein